MSFEISREQYASLYGPTTGDAIRLAFDEALATILDACRRHGVVPAIHSNAGLAKRRLEEGFRVVTVAEDDTAMLSGLTAVLDDLVR